MTIQISQTRYDFSQRLKAARKFRGLTQTQLSLMSNIPKSALSFFESSKRTPSLKSFSALIIALRVAPEYLLGLSDTMMSFSELLLSTLQDNECVNSYT
jgi:transcriptional regulator with XRE-family HTH domain